MTAATDPTQPDYYTDRAPAEEHQLRADFARYYQLKPQFDVDPAQWDHQLYSEARALETRWIDGDDLTSAYQWRYLTINVRNWEDSPEVFSAYLDSDLTDDGSVLTVDEIRSQLQVRELTGNGAWQPDPGSVPAAGKAGQWIAFAAVDDSEYRRATAGSDLDDPVPHFYATVDARHPDHSRSASFTQSCVSEPEIAAWSVRTAEYFHQMPGTEVTVNAYQSDGEGHSDPVFRTHGSVAAAVKDISGWQDRITPESGQTVNAFAAAAGEAEREGTER
ncbi:hypothetical protein [Nocardia sp. NPDC004722]